VRLMLGEGAGHESSAPFRQRSWVVCSRAHNSSRQWGYLGIHGEWDGIPTKNRLKRARRSVGCDDLGIHRRIDPPDRSTNYTSSTPD
jgi:hypothetical protein